MYKRQDESIDFFLSFFDDDEIETDDDSKQDELYTREKVNEFIQHEIDAVSYTHLNLQS